jgi:hypothetical protein
VHVLTSCSRATVDAGLLLSPARDSLFKILCKFPSKSRAHWLSAQVATVTFRPILATVTFRPNLATAAWAVVRRSGVAPAAPPKPDRQPPRPHFRFSPVPPTSSPRPWIAPAHPASHCLAERQRAASGSAHGPLGPAPAVLRTAPAH